jgi:hypothetical protein
LQHICDFFHSGDNASFSCYRFESIVTLIVYRFISRSSDYVIIELFANYAIATLVNQLSKIPIFYKEIVLCFLHLRAWEHIRCSGAGPPKYAHRRPCTALLLMLGGLNYSGSVNAAARSVGILARRRQAFPYSIGGREAGCRERCLCMDDHGCTLLLPSGRALARPCATH